MANVKMIRRRMGLGSIGGALVLACLLAPATASAQDFQAQAQFPAQQPPAASAEGTDHDRWVGRMGLGWYGVSDIRLGATGETISAPAIGVRYWLDRDIGIDAAIGFAMRSGSTSQTGRDPEDQDKPSATAFLLHGGLPIALHTEEHYSFLIIPEFNLGFASGTEKDFVPAGQTPAPDTDHSGFRLDIGARAGAEIHFGFIGIPALALEGSVGLFFTSQSGTTEQGPGKAKNSDTFIGTSSFNSPWDFFRSSVAARYYF